MQEDMPSFTASSYTSNSTSAANLNNQLTGTATITRYDDSDYAGLNQYRQQYAGISGAQILPHRSMEPDMAVNGKGKLRVVRVFLVDPDERVPVDKRVLHRSDEMTTDMTDQELFFSIPVNDLLASHNKTRGSVEWEEKTSEGAKSKIGLKDVRIRDLIMSVTTVAEFQGRAA